MSTIDENGFLEGSIRNWMTGHQECHASLFAAIRELNRECYRFANGRERHCTSTLHTTATALFLRLMELLQGMSIVVEHGMVSVSNIVFRAYIETYFYLTAIQKDHTFLAQYLGQLHIYRKKLVNRIRNSSSLNIADLREEFDEALTRDIDATIRKQCIKQWSIEEVARIADLHDIYLTAYAILSGAVHAAPWDLESYLDYDEAGKTIRGFKYGPSDGETVRILGLAGMCMADALSAISAIHNEDRGQLCEQFRCQFQAALSTGQP